MLLTPVLFGLSSTASSHEPITVTDNVNAAHSPMVDVSVAHTATPDSVPSDASVVGITNDGSSGYWEAATDGGVFSFDAPFHGSMGGRSLAAPVAGIAATRDGGGYWEFGADGGVFAFGDATYFGSLPGVGAGWNSGGPETVALVPTTDGQGYWEIDADGGVFAFGDATYFGSLPGIGQSTLGVVSATNWGNGYCVLESGGVVWCFNSGGSGETIPGGTFNIYTGPAVAIAGTADFAGFWFVTRTGQIYTWGTAQYEGGLNSTPWGPIDGISGFGDAGYNFIGADGGTFNFNLPYEGNAATSSELGPGYAQQIGQVMLPEGNWGTQAEWSDGLFPLWNEESGWAWNADNSSSGAYGVPQAIGGAAEMCTSGPTCPPPVLSYTYASQNNVWTQIMWGDWYIGSSYGGPEAAWRNEQRTGSYAKAA